MLAVLDRKWREHLYEMDYLKEGIGLRAMAQRDPLVEYQREGFDMFAAMLDSLKEESVGFLFNLQVQVVPAGSQPRSRRPRQRRSPAASAARPRLVPAAGSRGSGRGGSTGCGAGGRPSAPGQRPVEALPTQQAAAADAAASPTATGARRHCAAKGLGNGPAPPPR